MLRGLDDDTRSRVTVTEEPMSHGFYEAVISSLV